VSQMSRSSGEAARRTRWVAMWREAVSASGLSMGLVDLSTGRFVELSRGAAELLGTTSEAESGLDYLSVAERPREAAETLRMAREGVLDGIRARRKFRRPDGSMVELESSGWAIRSSTGPDLGLWVCSEVPSETSRTTVAQEAVTASQSTHVPHELVGTRVTVDNHWRLARASTKAGPLLGGPPSKLRELSIIELTHPDDLAALLFAFARATTEASASARVRLHHHDSTWRTGEVTPTVLEGDGRFPFALVVTMDEELGPPGSSEWATTLAGDLRRIAGEIEAAGAPAEMEGPFGLQGLNEFTARQWEVVSRLVRGERVATIASEMYVSRSTVRNHLSAIYRKVGAHSQHEFLALWRRG
jgi:PAS domain S-box-containing protein